MVNVQYALRRLVHVGVDANFSLVEPFVFESKVQPFYSLPEMFEARNLTPQPASVYFDTQQLYHTQAYVPYHHFERHFARQHSPGHFIHAVLFLTWADARWTTVRDTLANWMHPLPPPFSWCDSNLRRLPGWFNRTSKLHHLTPHVQVARALCAPPSALTSASFFRTLFDVARTRVAAPPLRCERCAAVAVANYRKHAVQHYETAHGEPVSRPVAPLPPSRRAFDAAAAVLARHGGGGAQPYTALHMRSGKAYAVLHGERNHSAFERWLTPCVARLTAAARATRRRVYVAADLFNDGWRGGETAQPRVRAALQEARRALEGAGALRLHAGEERALLPQDEMGMASAVDAAAAVAAEQFVFAVPSNFGGWVATLRAERGRSSQHVACPYDAA